MEVTEAWLRAFGQRVVQLRRTRELSQQALADAAGIDPTYLSGVEQGRRNLGLINICKLARAMDVSPSVFFQAEGVERRESDPA